MLSTKEIFATRSVGRDLCSDGILVPAAPRGAGKVAALVADTLLLDLEPVSRTVIGLDIITGGSRQVYK